MPLRLRKFIGAIALFVLVAVWALLAMGLAQVPAIHDHAILSVVLLRRRRHRLGAAGDADRGVDEPQAGRLVLLPDQAASARRKPFHIAVAEPDNSTRT